MVKCDMLQHVHCDCGRCLTVHPVRRPLQAIDTQYLIESKLEKKRKTRWVRPLSLHCHVSAFLQ